MSKHAAGRRCSSSLRIGFSRPMAFFESTYYYHGLLDSLNQNGNYPNATGISPFPAHPTPQKFWNSAAFDTTNPNLYYQIGNTGINTLLTPHTRNWDFSAVKNFIFRERHTIQFRFEAFNFSNHPNWATPSTNLLTSTFGVITSAYPMRQLQFALKYSF
jgi:hypothetical protein